MVGIVRSLPLILGGFPLKFLGANGGFSDEVIDRPVWHINAFLFHLVYIIYV